jgi:transaldolase
MTEDGLRAVNILSKEGIKTNVTLVFTVAQPYWVNTFFKLLINAKLSVAISSKRPTNGLTNVAELGSDIATIPGTLFPKLWSHPLTDAGIQAFLKDWEAFKK